MRHGGGMTWMPGTYDPALKLYYLGTGNPQPVETGHGREGDNLWTCSIVALNIDTGKIAWYYQVSPHDTHDWDATQTPVLIDGMFNGQPRKMLAQASRNGYYFLLDRTNGEHLVTAKVIETMNWSNGVNAKGQPIPESGQGIDGRWRAGFAEFHRRDQLARAQLRSGNRTVLCGHERDVQRVLSDRHRSAAGRLCGRRAQCRQLWEARCARSITRPARRFGVTLIRAAAGPAGILTTAGKLLFTGDGSQNLIAFDPATGKILWHAGLAANVSNGPETYMLDGQQYLVVGAGDSLVRVYRGAITGGTA